MTVAAVPSAAVGDGNKVSAASSRVPATCRHPRPGLPETETPLKRRYSYQASGSINTGCIRPFTTLRVALVDVLEHHGTLLLV